MLVITPAMTLTQPATIMWKWATGNPLTWMNATRPQLEAPTLVATSEAPTRWSNSAIAWGFHHTTITQWFGAMLPGLLVTAVTVWLFRLAWRLTMAIQDNQAFSGEPHRLLVHAGIAFACLTVAIVIGETAANMLIFGAVKTHEPVALLTLDGSEFVPLLAASLVVIISHAWKQAESLAGEVKATI